MFFTADETLRPADLRIIALVSLGLFFETYDIGLVNAALPQIAAGLGIEGRDTGFYLGAIRVGGLGAFLLIPFADRFGRRRVFLAALLGMSLGTLLTALSQTPIQFVAAQMATRVFLLTAQALAIVIVVEELPAVHRASGIGLMNVLGGLGFGVAAGLYAAVDLLPYGWRTLYGVGVFPVLLLPFFRRSLSETDRFQRESRNRAARVEHPLRAWAEPVLLLARSHPRRVIVIGLAGVLGATGGIAFFQYTSYFVQNFHGWSPGHYTLMVLGGGLLGVFGNVAGGRGSDRLGRRRVGFLGYLLVPAFVALFYLGPSSILVLSWGLGVFCLSAVDVVLRTLATEIFPTSHRASAGGWLIFVQTVGWSLGLFLVGIGSAEEADLPRAVTVVSMASVGAAVCLALVPESHGRELEEI
jgi:AAHS family benzoate transporter-like MFS transporter